MKKTTIILLFLVLFCKTTYAQLTYVPDDNFEQALIDQGYDSGALDDNVPTANIDTMTFLDVSGLGITNLVGIENFAALVTLYAYNNSLTSLDVSNNTALVNLIVIDNALSSLDVSNNSALIFLSSNNNNLTSLDISNSTALQTLLVSNNAFTSLDVSNNIFLETFYIYNNNLAFLDLSNSLSLDTLDVSSNPNLTCIQVDNVAYSNTNWVSTLDSQTSFSENCQTYIPDNNFEQALIDQGYDTGALDDYVLTANIATLTYLDVSNLSIEDLTGIEAFAALNTLYVSDNALTSLDVSNNTVLEILLVSNNALTSLDVSYNTVLQTLHAYNNSLTSLDLSTNAVLTILRCDNNELTSLNVKNGNNLNFTNFNTINNPSLTCIEVDDEAYSDTNWTNIDAQTYFSEDCSVPQTYVPDDNFEQALIDLGYDTGALDDYVATGNISTITYLNLAFKNISDLTGIEDFIALDTFVCSNNQLTEINLSQNTQLTYLNLVDNQLTSINLSQNTALNYLYLSNNLLSIISINQNTALTNFYANHNLLTSIDLSQNTLLEVVSITNNQLTNIDLIENPVIETLQLIGNQLTDIDLRTNTNLGTVECQDNNLQSFNMKNGNNANITFFKTTNNPNLTCLEVDDVNYSTTNWTNIDVQTNFSEYCNDSNCNNAQTIAVSSAVNTINFNLINEPINNEVGCEGSISDYADTWFEFTMPEDGSVGIHGAVNVNKFALYDACNGTEVACFSNTQIIDNLNSGTTYKLRVFRTAATSSNTSFSSFNIIFGNTLHVNDLILSKASIKLYPNPASESVTLISNSNNTISAITIVNISGQIIPMHYNSNTINVSHLANGIYFIKVEIDHQIFIKKLMINK